jgi:ABC-2 type transport system permease protein
MINRIKAITKKEFKQLGRDKRMLIILFFFPAFLLAMFGYAVNFDVENIKLAVYDLDNSKESRELINQLNATYNFEVIKYLESDSQIKSTLDKKDAQAVIVIPNDFSKQIYRNKEDISLQILIDGVDGNTASLIGNYLNGAVLKYNSNIQLMHLEAKGIKQNIPIKIETRFWFNPELQSTKFLIPGLIAMILIVSATISISLTLVREKEKGTIEQINVSSLTSLELLIGKTIPYLVIALINAAFILIAGMILFDVYVKGSYLVLLISTIIFLFASTSLGIFISAVSDSQQVAFIGGTFATLLPSLLLSGFVFPIESMPSILQVLTNITPAKFYIVALRGVILRGVGFEVFWLQLVYLMIFALLFLVLANMINNKRLGN